MYRPLDDSVFSCFSSKCCQTFSRSRRRCGKPVDRRRSSQRSTTRNIDENKYQRVGSNARERQIRSEISLLPGQHRLLLRSSSSNRFRKDQLQELFNVSLGRAKQVRAGYRPLENPTGTYFLPPDRAYSGKHTNSYHSVVAFSTLFFTLLLIISSISTSMTVQGVAGLADRSANKSLAPPSRISGNLVQPPGTPFRPMNALRTKVSPSKAVRLKNSRGLIGAMLSNQSDRSPQTVTAETPRKLFNVSNSRIFKSTKKRTTARETSFIGKENWLGVSGDDKLSPNLIEEKHRFLQPPGVSISNETKSFSLFSVKDLNLSSIAPDTESTLVNPKKVRKLAGSKRADDNYSSSSESDKRMSMSSLEVSAPERLFNRSRRYRKGIEIVGDSLKEAGQGSIETTQEQQVQQQQPKTCGVDAHANETADQVQDFRWNIDNPNMLLEEHFTTPFLSLHSDLQFPLEHSSKECLEDESFPAGKEEAATAAFESSFERYNRRQRLTAFDVCQSFGANEQKTKEYLYLPFCSHLRVIDALPAEDLGRLTADKTREEVCPSPVVRLLKFDQNAKSIHCLFENAISYYNCEDMYSKTARCDQCKVRISVDLNILICDVEDIIMLQWRRNLKIII